MRLAVISDMHGNGIAFEAVITDLKRQSPDAVLCLGDVTMRGPQPAECVAMLRALGPMAVVKGNQEHLLTRFPWPGYNAAVPLHELHRRAVEYDRARLSAADQVWLGALPESLTLTFAGVQAELHHAAPGDMHRSLFPWASVDELSALRTDGATRLILVGHIHQPFVRQAHGVQIVNAGSVGYPFDGDPRASYAIIDIDGNSLGAQIRRVPYDIESAIADARDREMPDIAPFAWAIRHAAFPYNRPELLQGA
ncbi:MAG: phosphodiesterase [Symbiobacteriaceae bacterium]|jgi:putative phosphoesterase|nr:phosphodiesterase [Symbiobacteriaceae bacterium]